MYCGVIAESIGLCIRSEAATTSYTLLQHSPQQFKSCTNASANALAIYQRVCLSLILLLVK